MNHSLLPSRENSFASIPFLSVLANQPVTPFQPQSPDPWQILQFAWESGQSFGWEKIGAAAAVALAITLVLLWPCARMIAGPKQVFLRCTLFLGSAVAVTAAFLTLAAFVAISQSWVALAILGFVYGAILFGQARHHFAISRAATAGVLACTLALTAGALYGTERWMGAMPWTNFLTKSQSEQGKLFASWQAGKSAITPAATMEQPTHPPAQHAAAGNPAAVSAPTSPAVTAPLPTLPPPAAVRGGPDLQALYSQLQKARATLDPNDAEAVARFNQQAAAYNQEKAFVASTSARDPGPASAKASR